MRILLVGAFSISSLTIQAMSPSIKVASNAIQPHMAIDPDGGIYVVFISGGNIEVSISKDKGKVFSSPAIAINALGKAAGGMQRSPRIAVDTKKTIYISDPITRWPDLVLVVSSDGGKSFSEPRVVNDVPKQNEEALHWLAASPNGDLHVAWLDRRLRGDNPGKDLAYAKITDQGRDIHKNLMLPGPICECCAPGITVDANGNPIIVYREGGQELNRKIFVAISTNHGDSFTQAARLNQTETKVAICPMDAPAVAATSDGKKIAVAWMDMRGGGSNRDVQWTIGVGGTFGPEVTVHDETQGHQGHPSVVFDREGTAWCAWEDGREGSQHQRIYAINSKLKRNFQVSESEEAKCGYPTLAEGGGIVGVAYEAGGNVSFRVLSGE